jgi:hypothetical protein
MGKRIGDADFHGLPWIPAFLRTFASNGSSLSCFQLQKGHSIRDLDNDHFNPIDSLIFCTTKAHTIKSLDYRISPKEILAQSGEKQLDLMRDG